MRLKDKVAFITGASGGLGRHFCKAFLKEGAKVCVTDITAEMVDSAVADLEAPDAVMGAVVDVCQPSLIQAAVAKTVDTFGRVDILVNVAGGGFYRNPDRSRDFDIRAYLWRRRKASP